MVTFRRVLVFSLLVLSLALAMSSAHAVSFSASTDKNNYEPGENVEFRADANENISQITLIITNGSSIVFNHTSYTPNSTLFNLTINSSLINSGEYKLTANFSSNNTEFKSETILKVSKAKTAVIYTDKSTYFTGELMDIDAQLLDKDGIGVSGESVTVKIQSLNGTTFSSSSGTTDSFGLYSAGLSAPSITGTYKIVLNDWVASKLFDVSNFNFVTYVGDNDGAQEDLLGRGDTAYIFADLFTPNKTKYVGSTESIEFNTTYPNGTSITTTKSYTGTKLNTSVDTSQIGKYKTKVTALSISKTITLSYDVADYELSYHFNSLNWEHTSAFLPNQSIVLTLEVFNASTGDKITTNLSAGPWNITILDANLNVFNSTFLNTIAQVGSGNEYAFQFTAPPSEGLYYMNIKFNDTAEETTPISVQNMIVFAHPVDQSLQFKDVFAGGKTQVSIIATLTNGSGMINATNISVLEVRRPGGSDITSSLTINTSIVNYKTGKAGLAQFASPGDSGWHTIKLKINNKYVVTTWFAVRLYSTCSRLSGYKWFVASSDPASLIITVASVQDQNLLEDIGGTTGSKGAEASDIGGFGTMYGMNPCSVTTSNSTGNTSINNESVSDISVTVTRVFNTLTQEDVTSNLGELPSGTTDSSGDVALNLTAPSGGWSGGTYLVDLSLRDEQNRTDTGIAWFNSKALWINIWPKQVSGYWKWYFGPTENMTFEVYSYNATSTWYWYGEGNGAGDNCEVQKVFYQGADGEWFWPPKEIDTSKYNATCVGSSGKFNLTISPNSAFRSGYYLVRAKVNTTAGLSDTGDGWFSVKVYNVYVKSPSNNWYDSWYHSAKSNISFLVDVTPANSTEWSCSWQTACSLRVTDPLNITVTKLQRYESWPPTEYQPSKYIVNITNTTSSQLVSINTTSGNATITLQPNGSWEAGYYNAIVKATGPDGEEQSSAWFEVRPFFVSVVPVDANGSQKYVYSPDGNITVNVSAANKPEWMKWYYNANYTYYNTTINNITVSYYRPPEWQQQLVSVNYTPTTVNGTTTITLTPNQALSTGSYNFEIDLQDSDGNTGKGYGWFEVKEFTISAQTADWKWEFKTADNITINVTICDPDKGWCGSTSSYSGSTVNLSVKRVTKTETWPYTDETTWTAASTQTDSNGKGALTIVPNPSLTAGYHMAEIAGIKATGGNEQINSVWFNIRPFQFSSWTSNWEYRAKQNVTLTVTADAAVTITSAQATCGNWPDYTTYTYSSSLIFNTTSIASGTSVVEMGPTSGKWASGYCYGSLTVQDSGGSTQSGWFSFQVKAFQLSIQAADYNNGQTSNVTLQITTDIAANITSANLSYWSDSESQGTYTAFSRNTSTLVNGTTLVDLVPTNGEWAHGYYWGSLIATEALDSTATQTSWISFSIPKPFTGWFYRVDASNSSIWGTETTTRNLTFYGTVNRFNSTTNSFSIASLVNVTIADVKKESCTFYPCSYTSIGTSAFTTEIRSTDSYGRARVPLNKTTNWDSGWYLVNFRVNDGPTTNATITSGLWVKS